MCLDAGALAVLMAVAVGGLRIAGDAATGTRQHRHTLEVRRFGGGSFLLFGVPALGALFYQLI